MAAQTVFSVEMCPVMEDGQSLSDMPRNTLPAPQLVMLANVAAAEGGGGSGGSCDGGAADEKEMMELKTVGSSYSDSEDESIIRSGVSLLHGELKHRRQIIFEHSSGFKWRKI